MFTSFLHILHTKLFNVLTPTYELSTPVLVVGGEAVDDDGYGQGEDEHTGQGAAAADYLTQQSLRVEVITHRGQGHQAPPCDGLSEHNIAFKCKCNLPK